jgi:ribonucleoside-diphosphate reductase alpha chain
MEIDMDQYQNFIALSRYARWLPEEERRETWNETVRRYVDYWDKLNILDSTDKHSLHDAIYNLQVMPSMRALMTAGPALDRDNVAGFNCSYLIMNRVRSFDELMYILLCGTGVGFSCERDEIKKLPEVSEEMHKTDSTIVVADSKIGWASAFRELVSLLYAGKIPRWDLARIRPSGAPLKTFGGRASGPEPLDDLFNYTVKLFTGAVGRRLTSLEVHGLVCKIAEVVVVGGVRRSALISLSSYSDDRLRKAKSGQWWLEHPEFALANNSIAYTDKPDMASFMHEWLSLVESKSGERGIFNRTAAQKAAARSGRRDVAHEYGTNPCSEIILRDRQFCNLSEVVIRSEDTYEQLAAKVRMATILGTLQSTLTDFRYLGKQWETNTKEERLLGVSLTGIMDHPLLSGFDGRQQEIGRMLDDLKQVAIDTNLEWAEKLGIEPSTAITCVKPSGTVSQLVDSSSGIHPRYSPYYIRTVRADVKDPLAQFMKEQGFPCEPDVMKPEGTLVFSFPIKSPELSVYRDDRTAIEQLEHWLLYQRHWCEHKPSVTIYVRDEEWLEVGAWVYRHFDEMSGVSFLPHSDHNYQQAPYQEVTKEQYEDFLQQMPQGVDWSGVAAYEASDMTAGAQNYACSGGVCEIVDLTP